MTCTQCPEATFYAPVDGAGDRWTSKGEYVDCLARSCAVPSLDESVSKLECFTACLHTNINSHRAFADSSLLSVTLPLPPSPTRRHHLIRGGLRH
jgi:hypothetical protein